METHLKQADYDQYDRQIHIWGAENQMKIMQSTILFINTDGLCTEIVKNVVLAGMNDESLVTATEYKGNYFLRKEDEGKNRCDCIKERLQQLNPQAIINTISPSDIQSFESFSHVIICNPPLSQLHKYATLCSTSRVLCIWSAEMWGLILNTSYVPSIDKYLTNADNSIQYQPESILKYLIEALHEDRVPLPSPIAIEAIIAGFLSQTLVSIITGKQNLECAIEFDATTLNVTEFKYYHYLFK